MIKIFDKNVDNIYTSIIGLFIDISTPYELWRNYICNFL